MANTYVSYYFRNSKHSVDSIRARLANVADYYEIPKFDRVKYHAQLKPRFGMAFWSQQFDNLAFPFCQQSGTETVISLQFPFGISELMPFYHEHLDTCLVKLNRLLWAEPHLLSRMHPPFCISSIDSARHELKIVTDGLALTRLYQLEFRDGIVWSNRISAAIIFSQEVPQLSKNGWGTQAVCGWFLDYHTPYENISVVRPGSFIKVRGDEGAITYQRHDCLHSWFTEPDSQTPNHAFRRFLGELKTFGSFTPISIGLSGGRDSRVLCSFLCRHLDPHELSIYTAYPPLLEKIIAQKLVEKLDKPFPWRARQRASDVVENDLIERALKWLKLYDGMVISDFLYMNPTFANWYRESPNVGVGVGGEGGEISTAYGYGRQQMTDIPFGEFLKSHPLTRFMWNVPFVHKQHKYFCKQILTAYVNDAKTYGITGYHFFDYWLLLARTSQAVVTGCSFTHLVPFAAPEYIQASFRMKDEDRFNSQLHRDIIAANQPRWADEPFYQDIQKTVDRDLITGLGRRIFVWETRNYEQFRALIRSEEHLGDIYDLQAVRSHFDKIEGDERPGGYDPSWINKIAYNMVMRYAAVEYRRDLLRYVQSRNALDWDVQRLDAGTSDAFAP